MTRDTGALRRARWRDRGQVTPFGAEDDCPFLIKFAIICFTRRPGRHLGRRGIGEIVTIQFAIWPRTQT
jgi:hypothetical protein